MGQSSGASQREEWTATVWRCVEPGCGFWREGKFTGVHQVFEDNGPGRLHQLEPVEVVPAEWREVAEGLAERLTHLVDLARMLRASEVGVAPAERALASFARLRSDT